MEALKKTAKIMFRMIILSCLVSLIGIVLMFVLQDYRYGLGLLMVGIFFAKGFNGLLKDYKKDIDYYERNHP